PYNNLPVLPMTPLEGGTAPGDSGGPLFAMVNGQLTQIGVARGVLPALLAYCAGPGGPGDPVVCPDQNNLGVGLTGFVVGNVYGQVSDWTPINVFLQWINENNPLRLVTAAPGNFNWSNPAAWIDAFPDPAMPNGAVPDNTRAVVNFDANQAARYYDVALSNPGTITLDMNPQIDDLSIMGAQSQLVIGGPFTLQALLDTTLSARTLTMLPGGTLTTRTYTQTGRLLQYLLAPRGAGRLSGVTTATLGASLRPPARSLGCHRDADTLCSIAPVSAPDRGPDQRPVRTIHSLPAVGISFALWAVLRSHFRRCDPGANPVRRRGRTDCEPAGGG